MQGAEASLLAAHPAQRRFGAWACSRCRRAGLGSKCVTSTARQVGRPRAAPALNSKGRPASPKSYTFLPPALGRQHGEQSCLSRLEAAAIPNHPMSSLSAAAAATPMQPCSFGRGLDPSDLGSGLGQLSSGADCDDLSWMFAQSATPLDHLLVLPGEDLFWSAAPSAPVAEAPTERSTQDETPAGLMVRLARINETITNQLVAAETFAPQPSGVGQAQDNPEGCHPTAEGPNENHISDALRVTSDFIDSLRPPRFSLSVTPPPATPGHHPSPTCSSVYAPTVILGTRSDGKSPRSAALTPDNEPGYHTHTETTTSLSTPATLLMLSGYIQLLKLFDIIFCRVHEFLQNMPDQSLGSCRGRTQAQLTIAGIGQVGGRLHIRIMVQAIEHQLDTLGRLLGLDPLLCLSDPSEQRAAPPPPPRVVGSGGGADNLQGQINAVIGSSIETNSVGASAREAIQSLRDAVLRVKALIS